MSPLKLLQSPVVLTTLCTLLVALQAMGQDEAIFQSYNQARTLLAQRKFDEAERLLQQALRQANQDRNFHDVNKALLTYEMGEVLLTKGDHASAEKYFQQTLAIRRKHLPKDHPSTSNAEDRLGEVFVALRRFELAEPLLVNAFQSRQRGLPPTHDLINRSYMNLGALYESAGRFVDAEAYFRKSVSFVETKYGKDSLQAAISLNALGSLQLTMGRLQDAEISLTRCLKLAESSPDVKNKSFSVPLRSMARLLGEQGRIADAEAMYQRALQEAERHEGPDSLQAAQILNDLAVLSNRRGKFAQAEERARTSIAMVERRFGKDSLPMAETQANLGLILLNAGEYGRAEVALTNALKIAETKTSPQDPIVATMLNNLGLLQMSMGLDPQAESSLLRALKIRESVFGGKHSVLSSVLTNLGDLYSNRSDYDRAESHYERARLLLEGSSGGSSVTLAGLLSNMYRMQMEHRKTVRLDLLLKSLAILETQLGPEHPDAAKVRLNLGYGYFRAHDYAKALPQIQAGHKTLLAALGTSHPDSIEATKMLGLAQYANGDRDAALRTIDAARRSVRDYVSTILPGLADRDQHKFLTETDATALSESLSIGLENRDREAFAELSATWLANAKATLHEARVATIRAASAGDSPEAVELRSVQGELVNLSISTEATDSQSAKRRAALLLRSQELTNQLADSTGRNIQPRPWTELAEIRAQLSKRAAFIDISRLEVANVKRVEGLAYLQAPRYVAWIVRSSGPVRVVDLGPADLIERRINESRKEIDASPKAITDRGEQSAETHIRLHLNAISEKILQPLVQAVGDADELVISPDGSLWLIPWSALPLNNGSYAVEKYQIRYVVTARDLVPLPVNLRITPSSPLIVADPDFDLDPATAARQAEKLIRGKVPNGPDSRGLAKSLGLGPATRLPGTASEAEAIAPRLEKWLNLKPRVFTGQQALKSVIKATRGPEALVLSTHGFFRPDQERALREPTGLPTAHRPATAKPTQPFDDPLLRCGLLLAGCNASATAPNAVFDDGLLTGLEVVSCDLRGTKLVVLSACETGIGQIRSGEGVAGLRQAFQLAGAEGVVATLWQVPDLPSAQLMTSLFENLAAQRNELEALSFAQRDAIAKRRERFGAAHPYFWAAYTLTGP